MSRFIRGIKNIGKVFTDIKKAVARKITDLFHKKVPRVRQSFKTDLENALKSHPTYQSLTNGLLRGHFGFPQGEETEYADSIVYALVQAVVVEVKEIQYSQNQFKGGLLVKILPSIFQQLYANPRANVITSKGESLPWLEWLLEAGSAPLVIDYEITFVGDGLIANSAIRAYSRSGIALMKESQGGVWFVPPEHQGTIDNNWITQSVEVASAKLERDIIKGL